MKIMLINTPIWKEVGFKSAYNPGMGLLYVGAVLREMGHEVSIIDAEAYGWWYDDICSEIERRKPTRIGLSSLSNGLQSSINLCKIIKSRFPDKWVALGGAGPSSFPQLAYDESGADSVTVGEAELILDKSFGERGIHFGIPPEDLDALPMPAYDLLEPAIGSKFWSGNLPKPPVADVKETVVMWSRGCPHSCIFCSKATMKQSAPRLRSPEKISEELKMLRDKFGINSVFVYDDELIGMSEKNNIWLYEISSKLSEWNDDGHFNPSIWLKGQGRCSKRFVSEEVGLDLKDAGFFAMMLGCESGSEKVKQRIKKGTTNEDIKHTLSIISKLVDVYGFWMIGMPEETSDEARETERLIFETAKYMRWIQITIFSPLPGSVFWGEAIINGWLCGSIENVDERNICAAKSMAKNFQVDSVLDMPWMSREEILKWQKKLYMVYESSKRSGD